MRYYYTALLTLILPFGLHAETLHVVKDGKLTEHANAVGKSWQENTGDISGTGVGQKLGFKHRLKGKTFTITAQLALEKFDHTAAGIYLGAEYFGFDGRQGFFTEGGSFGKLAFHKGPKLTAGKAFAFGGIGQVISGRSVSWYRKYSG